MLATLRVDGSQPVRSYIKFNVTGINGPISSATLRVFANSAHPVGYEVYNVPISTWTESSINYSNAPAFATGKVGSSGKITGPGSWTSVLVTPSVVGNGFITFGLSTTSVTNLTLSSLQGANAAELVIVAGARSASAGVPMPDVQTASTTITSDQQAPTAPVNVTASPAGPGVQAWSLSTDNVAVVRNRIYKNGRPVHTATLTAGFLDVDFVPAPKGTYPIRTFDAARNTLIPACPPSTVV
jgi:hypothetical protein